MKYKKNQANNGTLYTQPLKYNYNQPTEQNYTENKKEIKYKIYVMSENVEKKIFIADKFLTSYICLTDVQSKHSFTLTGLIVTAV